MPLQPTHGCAAPRTGRLASCVLAAATLALALPVQAQPAAPATSAPPTSDRTIYDKAVQGSGQAWKLLERLVNIDSGSFNAAGLDKVGEVAAEELQKLGARVEKIPPALPAPAPAAPSGGPAPVPPPARSDNIVATFEGSGSARILLMAHTDTVLPDGAAAARPFRISAGRAYGPGVLDNKGGIVVGLQALDILRQIGFTGYGRITLLLNTNEETGSAGSRALIEKLAREHDMVLNLEPGLPGDGLVTWRKGSGNLEVNVRGLASHAGMWPERGRNALTELSHQVLQLGRLGDAQKLTTINFTVAAAGERKNVIPDGATAFADVRATSSAEFDRLEQDAARLSQNRLVPDTQVSTTLRRAFPPMAQNPQTDALAARAQRIYAELGRTLALSGTGGASDASLAGSVGTPALDGFGLVGDGAHTDEEYAETDSLVPRVYLLTRMLLTLGAGHR